jgi:hypothetical protein
VGHVDRALEAAAALYSGAILEQLRPFALADRIVGLWLHGGVPVGPTSDASRALDFYWLQRTERVSDEQRRGIYARVFDAGFDELWTALLAALAQPDADAGQRAEDVRAHVGAHIDEEILDLTPRLHAELAQALEVLDSPEILESYGARDIWELVDQLARMEPGTAPDVARARTMAASGTAIIGWLAAQDGTVTEDVVEAAQSWLAVVERRA